jgi:hypothetical protein
MRKREAVDIRPLRVVHSEEGYKKGGVVPQINVVRFVDILFDVKLYHWRKKGVIQERVVVDDVFVEVVQKQRVFIDVVNCV